MAYAIANRNLCRKRVGLKAWWILISNLEKRASRTRPNTWLPHLEDLGDWSPLLSMPILVSWYAEQLASLASSFDGLYASLQQNGTFMAQKIEQCLENYCHQWQPDLVVITRHFPATYCGFYAARWFRQHHPSVRIAMGGGYVNTELRSLSDERVFEYVDFVSLDDGELPLACIIEVIDGKRKWHELKRCFVHRDGVIQYINGATEKTLHRDTGTPGL